MQKHIHTVGHFTLGSSSNRPVHRRMKPVGSSWSNISTFHWLDLRSRKQIIQFQFCLFFCFCFFVSGGSGWNCNVNKEAWNFGLRPPSCLSIPSSHRFFQVWAKGPFQKLGVSRQSTPTQRVNPVFSLFRNQESQGRVLGCRASVVPGNCQSGDWWAVRLDLSAVSQVNQIW